MFVITADQVGSRLGPDRASAERARIERDHGLRLMLPADLTAGDEIQMLSEDPATALAIVLELTRTQVWSVGIGIGTVRDPLPNATREATGEAFFAARDAVERAKSKPTRFALRTGSPPQLPDRLPRDSSARSGADGETGTIGTRPESTDGEALIDLLLVTRARRSAAGWELYDLLAVGLNQQEAAARLSITPSSASSRARAADLKVEAASRAALTRLLATLDDVATRNGTH